MSLRDRILGRKADLEVERSPVGASMDDARAVERYERMLRTAPADVIENVHVAAFEKLTPSQLDLLYERFTANAATLQDRPADARPATLARAARQTEVRHPGTLTRIFDTDPHGRTPNSWIGASILDTIAWYAITSVAFSSWAPYESGDHTANSTDSNSLPADAARASADPSAIGGFWDFEF